MKEKFRPGIEWTESDSNAVPYMEFDPPVYSPRSEKILRHLKGLFGLRGFWRDHFWEGGEPRFPKKGI